MSDETCLCSLLLAMCYPGILPARRASSDVAPWPWARTVSQNKPLPLECIQSVLAREETAQGGDTMHRGSPRVPGMVPRTSLRKTELGKSHPESGVLSEPQMSSPVNSQVNRRGRSHERGRRPKSASRASPTAHITIFEF